MNIKEDIKEAIEIVRLTESYAKLLNDYAIKLFEEKLKELKLLKGPYEISYKYHDYQILSNKQLRINYKFDKVHDMDHSTCNYSFNDSFTVNFEVGELPYIFKYSIETKREYNKNYGDDRICKCGHPYHRHFDSYEENSDVGCKYCQCYNFVEDVLSDEDKDYIDYISMLFDNNIKWDIKKGPGKTLEELKLLAKENNLNLENWRNK